MQLWAYIGDESLAEHFAGVDQVNSPFPCPSEDSLQARYVPSLVM